MRSKFRLISTSIPHRSPDPISMAAVRTVVTRAEQLGFADLWVTENTIDQAYSFDPMTILSYAAAVDRAHTSRRLGCCAAVAISMIHVSALRCVA